jgi:hypothetical protein
MGRFGEGAIMHLLRVLLVGVALLGAGGLRAEQAGLADSRRAATPFGELTIVEEESGDETRKCIMAGRRKLHCTDQDLLFFSRTPLVLQNYAVVFVGEDCDGTACWTPPPTNFVVLSAGGARFQASPFTAFWSEGEPRVTGANAFSLTLPYFDGKVASLRFSDGQFRFEQRVAEGPTRLAPEDCDALYEESLRQCAAFDPPCTDLGGRLSGVGSRAWNKAGLYYGRFPERAMNRLCEQACASRQLPDRVAFDRDICRAPPRR